MTINEDTPLTQDDLYRLEQEVIRESFRNPATFIQYLTGYKLADHHRVWLGHIFHPDVKRLNIIAPRESGKALHKDERVITARGIIPISNVVVGDYVKALDNTFAPVTGVYPQGEKQVCLVTLSDGKVIRACQDHLWPIYGYDEPLTTQEIYHKLKSKEKVYLPTVAFIGGDVYFNKDYYQLGVSLIDDIPSLVIHRLDYHQMASLLMGILDVYGEVDARRKYITVPDTIRFTRILSNLVRALGGIFFHKDESYGIFFHNKRIKPFFNLDKLRLYYDICHDHKHKSARGMRIVSVEYTDNYDEMYCIAIDHPSHCYLLDGFIPTHNTTVVTYAMLWYLGRNPLSTNLIISVSSDQAMRRGQDMESVISHIDAFHNVFPYLNIDTRRSNNKTEFSLYPEALPVLDEDGYVIEYTPISYATWRQMLVQHGMSRDPTMYISGLQGRGVIGKRVKGILLMDDIVDESMRNITAQQSVLEYIFMTLEPLLNPDSKAINIGTRWMPDDIYEQLEKMTDSTGKKIWKTVVTKAIFTDKDGKEQSYWPEYWPLKRLYDKKAAMRDDVMFNTMYMCDPSSAAEKFFDEEMLSQPLPLDFSPSEIIITTDLAVKTNASNDFSVFVAYGIEYRDNGTIKYLCVLDALRIKTAQENAAQLLGQFFDQVESIWNIRPTAILIEDVAFQVTFLSLAQQYRPDLPIYGQKPKGSKEQRAYTLAQYGRQGRFFINQGINPNLLYELKREFLYFKSYKHDDIVDACSLITSYLTTKSSVSASVHVIDNPLHRRTFMI